MEQDRCGLQAKLLELTHDAVFTWRLDDGLVCYWNPGAERIFGYSAAEATGQDIHQLLGSEFPQGRDSVWDCLRNRGRWEGSIRHICKDGICIHTDSRMICEADDGGKFTVLETCRDISDQVVSENALRIGEERFRSFVMATAQAVVIADPNGEIVLDSPSWREFTGQTYQQCRGRGWAAVVHPDDLPRAMESLQQSIANGTVYDIECRIRRADGQYRWAHLRSVPVLNPDSSVREWIAAITDITEKKQAQEAIRANEERLHFALDAGAMITWDWNLATDFTKRTGPANTLFSLADSSAEEFLAPVDPRDRGWLFEAIEVAKTGAAPLDAEFRMVSADGRVAWILAKGSLREDLVSAERYLTGVAMNVSKRRRAEERLKLLDAISETTRDMDDPELLISHTIRLLGQHLDASRCSYIDRDEQGHFSVYREWVAASEAGVAQPCSTETFAAMAARELRHQSNIVVRDVDGERYEGVGQPMYRALGSKAFICCPVPQQGRVVGIMIAHQDRPRNWTAGEAYIVEKVAERCWSQLDRVRATEALRRNEAHLSALVEQSAVGIVETDLSGRIVLMNEKFARLLGLERGEILGRSLHDLTHPEDRAQSVVHLAEAVDRPEPCTFEQRYLHSSGATVWVSTTISVVSMPGEEKPSRVLGILQDMTERKQAEEQVLEVSNRLQMTLESAEIGEWDLDLATNTAHRSARHDRCFGYTEPPAQWGFDEFIAHVHPDDRDSVARQFCAAADKAQDWHFECRVVWPDQSIHWIASHGRVYQRGNEAVKLNGIVLDITGRKSFEASLRRSERLALEAARQAEAERRRLDAVLEAVPTGIAVVELGGAVVEANPALWKLWGASNPRLGGFEDYERWKGWWADGTERHGRRLHPGDWTVARALRGEESPKDILEIETFDSPPVRKIILASAAPIKGSDGTITGAVAVQMDITDRMRAEEALKEANRRKDEFLAMLAHELRNPLAPISAAADLLRLADSDTERVQKASAIISRQVRHMSALVDDLLDVSRVTRGIVTLSKVRLDAKRVLTEAVEQVRPLIELRRHQLVIHTPPDSAFVMADHKRLVQVITNLLNNAAKYTPEGGVIGLGLEVDADAVRLIVADNGIGMSPALVDGAFELFVQAERNSDRSQGGLGIGLALVRSLVGMHGGTVTAYSEGLGKGSRFVVSLPLLLEQGNDAESSRDIEAEGCSGSALKILIVEDNIDAAQTLAMFCEALGHQVIVEHSSRAALERAEVETLDACLLDIGLPDMDGNELAQRLRAMPQTAEAMLVAVTGYGQEQDREMALQSGFDHHFVKPLNMAKLATVLNGSATAH